MWERVLGSVMPAVRSLPCAGRCHKASGRACRRARWCFHSSSRRCRGLDLPPGGDQAGGWDHRSATGGDGRPYSGIILAGSSCGSRQAAFPPIQLRTRLPHVCLREAPIHSMAREWETRPTWSYFLFRWIGNRMTFSERMSGGADIGAPLAPHAAPPALS
jgi:hypothetical protein